MDFLNFSDINYDHKEWINIFISNTPTESLEKEITNTVIKLQLGMQEMNGLIDETTASTFQILPRLMREMESVRQEALMLQEQMSLVKTDIEKVEQSTQDNMRNLLKLHLLKEKLCFVEKSLQEASNWNEVYGNIENIMNSGDVYKISEKILVLQNCLVMLKSAPDYEDRKTKVDNLCNRFESILGPKLIQAYLNKDENFARQGLKLFSKIGRQECGPKYYGAWFKPTVVQLWKDCKDTNDWTENVQLLKHFYIRLVAIIREELKRDFFSDPVEVVVRCLIDSLNELEKEFDEVVSKQCIDILDSTNCLQFLKTVMTVMDEFAIDLEKCISGTTQCPEKLICKLSDILYNQVKGIDEVFRQSLQSFLKHKLNNIKMDVSDIGESIEVLDASVDQVILIAKEAITLCQEVTRFTALDFLITCLKELFVNFTNEFKRVSLNIILKLVRGNEFSSGSKSKSALSGKNASFSETDMMDSSSLEHYFFLQDGIRLTAVGGHLSIQFDLFIHELCQQVLGYLKNTSVGVKRVEGWNLRQYSRVLLDSNSANLEKLWKKIQTANSQTELLQYGNFNVLSEEVRQIVKFQLLQWLNRAVFDHVLEPIKNTISNVKGGDAIRKLPVWNEVSATGEILPQYAYSPQEYITKIGQFFMTLPQQLEPFLNVKGNNYHEALLHGQLPYLSDSFLASWLSLNDDVEMTESTDSNERSSERSNNHTKGHVVQVAHVWLESIVAGCLNILLDEWLAIEEITIVGKQQLYADVAFIVSLVEDLDLTLPVNLKCLQQLLSSDHLNQSEGLEINTASASVDNEVPIKMKNFAKLIEKLAC